MAFILIGRRARTEDSPWDAIASRPSPSWYLDPLVAQQKREVHRALIRRWSQRLDLDSVLKTDLFEEAFGDDHVWFDLFPATTHKVGIDVSPTAVARARRRCAEGKFSFLATDVRAVALRSDSFDLVFSNSTLDHFDSVAELRASVAELVRVVRPGGVLVITLDNPANPLYPVLRRVSRRGWAPFAIGCTVSRSQLNLYLAELGMEVMDNDWLIHNPRLLSTALFLGLRKVGGRWADAPIGWLLRLFELFGKLPSKRFTACFLAACARKPALPPPDAGLNRP